MSDYDEDTTCPLCMDPLDATDQAINFCQCGYKMCLWCWNQLMETANREALPGRCPNCRTEYDKEKITMAQLDPDVIQREQQRKKEQTKKKAAADTQHRPPRSLGQVRVVQRTLVYAVGMPLSICREEVLADRHYFGQFGRIKKVSVNRSTPFSQVQKNGPSGSAYVTFYRPEDALRCIEAVDGSVWEGKTIKACFGTTKYCNAFLKGVPCNNPDCLYLHAIAEPGDSFSKEDMMANGLDSGRTTFFDLVHPTNTKEASAHAHAVLQSMGSGSGGGAGGSAAVGNSSGAVAQPASQPMAITGARRTSTSASPWGSVPGDGPATASPSRPGAAAMAAAAARWGSMPRATPPAAVPQNSPLADVEWPSLGATVEPAPDAPKHAAPAAADSHHATVQAATANSSSGSRGAAAAAPLPHPPSTSASVHPVSHPVGHGTASAAPTAAAVVAGKVPAAAAAAASKQQQQQQQGKQQQKATANAAKNGKGAAAQITAAGKADAAASSAPLPAATKPKQSKAEAAAAAKAEAEAAAAQEQQPSSKDIKAVEQTGTAAPVVSVVAESTTASSSKPPAQVNGKISKQDAKKAAKAAAKQAAKEAAAAEKDAAKAAKDDAKAAAKAAKEEAAAAAKAAKEQAAAAAKAVKDEAATAANAAKDQIAAVAVDRSTANGTASPSKPPASKQEQQAGKAATAVAPPAAAAASPAIKAAVPPPGFAAATPARIKGPPPGFQGTAAAVQQRPPPPGFEPSLLALARAGSSTSLGQLGQASNGSSGGGGAPPGMFATHSVAPLGLSPLGNAAAPAATAGTGLPDAGVAGTSANGVEGMHSRGSSDVDTAAVAAGPVTDDLAVSSGGGSRPQSRGGSLQGTLTAADATPAKASCPASDAGVTVSAATAAATPPLVGFPQQHTHSLFGNAATAAYSPLPGFQTRTPPQQQLFGTPATAVSNGSSGFDINAFFDAAGPYTAPGAIRGPPSVAGSSLFGGSLVGTPIAQSPLAMAAAGSGCLGAPGTATADAAAPLSARKQSRFSFAQQPQQQQQVTPAPAPVTPVPQQQPQQQQFGGRAPPGFPAFGGPGPSEPAATAASASAGAFGGFGGAFAGQHAASFFKTLLPGVNVHVAAASPPTPAAATMAAPVGGFAAYPMQGPAASAPNPGLALLQQLQRGNQQFHQH